MQRVQSGLTTEVLPYVTYPGLSTAAFTVDRSRGGAALAAMTTPTVTDLGDGLYTLLLDEDTTITAGKYTEPMDFVIKHTSLLQPIHAQIELFLPSSLEVIETEGSITRADLEAIMLSVLAGVTTNGGLTFKTPNGNATRVIAVTNASNERTSITLSPP